MGNREEIIPLKKIGRYLYDATGLTKRAKAKEKKAAEYLREKEAKGRRALLKGLYKDEADWLKKISEPEALELIETKRKNLSQIALLTRHKS